MPYFGFAASGALALLAYMFWSNKGKSKPEKPEVTASIYGASETAGGYCIPPDETLLTVDPTPCEMMTAAGPVRVVSKSINGLRLSELMEGGTVKSGVGLGDEGHNVVAFATQLKTDPGQLIVVSAGMVDCLFDDITVEDYMNLVKAAVAEIGTVPNRYPVIRGYNRFVPTDLMTQERLARVDQFNAALKSWCESTGVDFGDVYEGTPFAGVTDMAPDMLHRSKESHQVIANFMAKRLEEIARSKGLL